MKIGMVEMGQADCPHSSTTNSGGIYLVPQQALNAILVPHMQPTELFNGTCIFVHAPQYHWHMEGAEDE